MSRMDNNDLPEHLTDKEYQKHLSDFGKKYLEYKGWFHSVSGLPCNAQSPLPWYTYPAISYISRLVKPEWRLFEYGCGSSTLWWSRHVSEVISVEHERQWFSKMQQETGSNVKLVLVEMDEPVPDGGRGYLREFAQLDIQIPLSVNFKHNLSNGLLLKEFKAYALEIDKHKGHGFDVVVVDGMARMLTAFLATKYLKPGGVMVFDNADRWQYNPIFEYLDSIGYRRIDFFGPGPAMKYEWCTSIFINDLAALEGQAVMPRGSGDLGW